NSEMNNKKYQIKIEKDRLFFITTSFKAEQKSVLPKGIYTKEFASMLSASAACMFVYMVISFASDEIIFIHLLIIILTFIAAFLGSRKFLFKEKYMEVVFDRTDNTVRITLTGIIKATKEEIPLDNIKSIDVGSKKFTPENIDGINFVEKISLQHGSFVPGLRDEEEFITLSLKLNNGSERTIYSERIEGKIGGEPELPLKEMSSFLVTKKK
ncbi:MAG: hypothetical protein L0956_09280, partial [Candidatus Mariimomonas ferrooxydans]